MTTDLIRWEDSGAGGHLSGFLGYVGTLGERLFRIWAPAPGFSDEWTLEAAPMPGRPKVRHGTDPDELKAAAEELLREWVSSLGAVFPGDQRIVLLWRDERRQEICRSAPLEPGTKRIAIPIDAQFADLIGDDQ